MSTPFTKFVGWASIPALALVLALAVNDAARADDQPALVLTLKGHHFDPATPTIPSDKRVKIQITNLDATPAEVESDDFKLEKVLPPGATVVVTIGPLKAGSYEIHDEYNEDVSKTKLIAR